MCCRWPGTDSLQAQGGGESVVQGPQTESNLPTDSDSWSSLGLGSGIWAWAFSRSFSCWDFLSLRLKKLRKENPEDLVCGVLAVVVVVALAQGALSTPQADSFPTKAMECKQEQR